MNRGLIIAFLLVVTFVLTLGCADDGGSSTGSGTPPPRSYMRIAQFSPEVPPVDLWVDHHLLLSHITYRTVSSHMSIQSGDRLVEISEAGTNPPTVLYSEHYQVTDSDPITITASGSLPWLEIVTYIDNRTPDSSLAQLRFIHLTPDAEAVDVSLAPGPDIGGNIYYLSSSSYRDVTPGAYDVLVRVAGTGTMVLHMNEITFAARHNYTLFMSGSVHNNTVEGYLATDAGD